MLAAAALSSSESSRRSVNTVGLAVEWAALKAAIPWSPKHQMTQVFAELEEKEADLSLLFRQEYSSILRC